MAATGTGKTRVAIEAMLEILQEGGRVAVIVPTIALQEQWFSQLRYELRIGPDVLGTMGGRSATFALRHRVLLCVLNSARQGLSGMLKHWADEGEQVLLIVDECHRLGSKQAADLLKAPMAASLGLSATPQNDDGTFEPQIRNGLGPIVYELPLRRALDERLLAPLRLLDIYFDLPPSELHEFRIIQEKVAGLQASLFLEYSALREAGGSLQVLQHLASGDDRAHRLLSLLQQNRRLVANSKARKSLFVDLINLGILDNRRALVFNETIAQAEGSLEAIENRQIPATIDHSKVPAEKRSKAISKFASGLASVLVAVRTVDEGIDVPEADLAVIVSGTLTKRQRVQRIGRVVRPSGTIASVFSLLARGTTEEFFVGMEDRELLGAERVRACNGIPSGDDLAWVLGQFPYNN